MSATIVTFYSYKGGVGRSMALANVAVLLARRGLKVLAVDWDLEAPGLERYFANFVQRESGRGLLRLFMDAAAGGSPELDDGPYRSIVECEAPHPITLLASGRELDPDYSRSLEHFDWSGFFSLHRGGDFVERLRDRWRADFDIVLIDSRTGLSDTGGICTIQLPDVVVAMFTANFQSVYGVRDVMRLAQHARQGLAYDRMPLTVLPLPARWGMQEFQETQIWLSKVVDAMQEFFDDWLPKPLTARDVIERLRLPQQDFFSFGERLAVVEQGVADPAGLGFVYDRVAAVLQNNFAGIDKLLGIAAETLPASQAPPGARPADRPDRTPGSSAEVGYEYDVFVSYEQSSAELAVELARELREELRARLGYEPRFFINISEIRLGAEISVSLERALARSRVLLAVLTPRYAVSPLSMHEYLSFYRRVRTSGKSVVLPVMLRRGVFPPEINSMQWIDLSNTPLRSGFLRNREAARQVMEIARILQAMIEGAPTFDPRWEQLPEP